MTIDLLEVKRSTIVSALRRVFSRCVLAKHVRLKAKDPVNKGPRGGALYICAECGNSVPAKQTNIDHISPVVQIEEEQKNMSWDLYMDRLFCGVDNLQCLCLECHKAKSAEERAERARAKRERKAKGK